MVEILGTVALAALAVLIGAAGWLVVVSALLAILMAAEGDPLADPLGDDEEHPAAAPGGNATEGERR